MKGLRYSLIFVFSLLTALILPPPAHARVEFTYLYGKLKSPSENGRAIATQWEYLQELPKPFAFSLTYLNEGHLDDPDKHHRDGFALQVWARRSLFVPWFSVAAGTGPYYWYDTQHDSSGLDDYVRGYGMISTASAKIQLPYGGLFVQGRFNWVETVNNIDTKSVLLGIGTDFPSTEIFGRSLPEISNGLQNEILLHLYNLTHKRVGGIEYRRNLGILGDHVEASASYFYTNDKPYREYESYGAATELWVVNTVRNRFKFGFGGGLFVDLIDSPYDVSGVVSFLIAFRISNRWNFQYRRSRILPNERDEEDIRTLALGYVF